MATVGPSLPGSSPNRSSPIPPQTQENVGPNPPQPPHTRRDTAGNFASQPVQNNQQPSLSRSGPSVGGSGAKRTPTVAEAHPGMMDTIPIGPISPPNPHRDPVRLPQCREQCDINIYPHARVIKSYRVRAESVIEEFRKAILRSREITKFRIRMKGTIPWWKRLTLELRFCNSHINFEPRICGPSTSESKPSILVICPEAIYPMLKRELEKEYLQLQYAEGRTSRLSFGLFYYPTPRDPHTLLWCEQNIVLGSINQTTPTTVALTMCGARVHPVQNNQTSCSSFATTACLFEIKSELFGLTAAHPLITAGIASSHTRFEEYVWRQAQEDTNEMDQGDEDYYLEYDMDDFDKDMPDATSSATEEALLTVSNKFLSTVEESTAMFPGPGDLIPNESDGDWAVFKIKREDHQLPNAYAINQFAPQLRFITEIAHNQPNEERPVHILTSKAIKYGTLTLEVASLGTLSGRGPTSVWVVSMTGLDNIERGDSGSLVVDAITTQLYGHVVASGLFGDIYIVPIPETLQQIRYMFQTTDICLPDPLRLLTEAALFHLDEGQYKQARAAIKALADLVQQLCDARKWLQLSHWINTSASRIALLGSSDDDLAEVFPEIKDRLHVFREPLMLMHVIRQMMFAEGPSPETFSHSHYSRTLSPYLGCDLILLAVLEERRFRNPRDSTLRSVWGHLWEEKSGSLLGSRFSGLSCTLCSSGRDRACPHAFPQLRSHRGILTPFRRRNRFLFDEDTEITNLFLQNHLPSLSLALSSNFGLGFTRAGSMLIHTLLKSSQQLAYGRFSTVHSAIIPDTLLTSWSLHGETRIALKIIEKRATHFSLWLNEKEILQQLEQFNHPNIVKLLDSYCIDDKYLLLFPLAKGDLADFMLSDPQTSQPMFTWLLQQLRGLTKALEYLHYGNESIKACGRHGDVKPQNILWYGAVDQDESKYGKLVIADLGLSEFRYSTATPSYSKACPCDAVSPSRKRADRQYAPPEIEVAMQMSSASDIWGLGCVFLEIVVWLVDGAESRNSFLRDLHSDSPGQPASYWRMEMTPQRLIFSLKPHISIRLQQLLERTKGDSMLHTFITYLTYSTLLDPNPLTRPTARDIGNRLLEVESGVSMEWGTSTQNLPVWSRHWIHQDHQTSFSCYSPSELEDRLFCTLGTDMVGTDIALHSQKIQDGSLALWQYDDTLEYNWVDELPFKQKCPFCKEVGRPPALKPHIKSQHRDRLFHDCDDCGALFAKKEQLIQHQKGANFQIREGVYVQIPCIFPRNVLATSLKGTVHGLLTKFALTPEVNQPSEEPRHPSQPEPIFCSSNPCICYDSSPNARPRSTCKYGRRVCFDHRASNSHVKKHRSDKGETLSPFLDFKYI